MKNAELEKVVLESGLELSEGEQIKQSYLPFFVQIAEIKEESKKINFENPSELDEKIARELRLRMVKIRTGSATIKDERKKIHLLRGNLEQSSYNLIKSGCELEEEIFLQVEKKREIAETLRKLNLKNERLELLKNVCETPEIYPLSEMDETQFNDLFEALTIAKQQKEEKEKAELLRLENERIEREKAIEVQRLENEQLKQEAEKREKELAIEREKVRKEKEAIELKVKQEAEKLAEQNRIEKEKQDLILQKEREEKQRLENELKEKQEQERKIELENELKEKAESLAKIKAEKAPIKDKLKLWVGSFNIENAPIENETTKLISEKFELFRIWAITNIENL